MAWTERVLVLAAVALLISGTAYDFSAFSRQGSPTASTTHLPSVDYEEVAGAYSVHLTQLDSRDIVALADGYESNATVELTGAAALPFMAGNYSGSANIKALWGSFVGRFVNFSVSDENQSIGVEGGAPVVNSTFDFRGYSVVGGNVTGSVIAQDVYVHVNSSWLIARETWSFTQFNGKFPQVAA
jgi:hypothetical protein